MLTQKAAQTTTHLVICLMLTGLLLTACGPTTPAKTYTIGVVNYVPALDPVFAGFKAQMAALGYAEGKNVTYLSYLSSVKAGAVVTYAGSFPAIGQQAARLADQILKGIKPGDLPVETAEYFLHINLQTATAIGLDIPDEILRQADRVIR